MTKIGAPSLDTKLRGGYYTPPELAEILADWAIRTGRERVLEPSCGDGSFLNALRPRLKTGAQVTAVELFPDEADLARGRGCPGTEVVVGDVFNWYASRGGVGAYDAVLGNPPFIRYQSFPEAHRQLAFELMRAQGLSPTRLTNAWLPFVVLATHALRNGGRLGLVLPAEVLQVGYAAELREYLARNYSELTIVTFRRLVFKGIQQETVLLMGVRDAAATARIVFRELHDLKGLASLNGDHDTFTVDLDHAREKWTQYYLSGPELGLVREIETSNSFTTLGAMAEVDVGIVTGRNEFFVTTPDEARRLGIASHCLPLVGKSAQIPGLCIGKREWRALAENDGRCLLVNLKDLDRRALDSKALSYIKRGERAGYHEGYKCRVRQPRWWVVPSAWVPDAFLLRQIYDGPRIVLNAARATCTDTIHRVRLRPGIRAADLAAVSVNSLTCAFAEIRGRSYGGGVLELEPSEAEALPFPEPKDLPDGHLDQCDELFRQKGLRALQAEVDRHVLREAGLSVREIRALRGIWSKLSSRRMERTRRPQSVAAATLLYGGEGPCSVQDMPLPPARRSVLTSAPTLV